MDGIGAIPIFVAVVENGGFTSAADRLGISKSAVSKRISQLEARLGVQLLHRSTRRISLTEAGERYFGHAVEAFAAAKEAEDAVAQLQGAPQGRLRINAPMSFGRLHIAPLIPEFLKRYPGIEIEMVQCPPNHVGFQVACTPGLDLVDRDSGGCDTKCVVLCLDIPFDDSY